MEMNIIRAREADASSIPAFCRSVGDSIRVVGKDGFEYKFSVVHITDEKIYFMSDMSYSDKNLADAIEYLKTVEENLPDDLLAIIGETHHKSRYKEYVGKISLPSAKNVDSQGAGTCSCSGEDDIVFDAFKDNGAARCRNCKDGYTVCYWTDTSIASYSATFYYVSANGHSGNYSGDTLTLGVCLCFYVRR